MRVAIYTRVSTEDQAKEGFSLEAQLERLQDYCEAQGWDVAATYVDEGHSGRSTKRPSYQRMMEERDRWDLILVMKMDRIHRNSKNFMLMMEDLEGWGKDFSSMTESLDTSTAMGRFVVDMIQRIAQLESEQIGERTYMGMRQKAEAGEGVLGFRVPYGYRLVGGSLSIDENESDVVEGMFSSYVNGQTMDWISWDLNRREVPTRNDNQWSLWSVSRILHNPVYAGFLRWDGLIVPSEHEAVVSVSTFNLVQELAASRIRNPDHRRYLRLPETPKGVCSEEELTIAPS